MLLLVKRVIVVHTVCEVVSDMIRGTDRWEARSPTSGVATFSHRHAASTSPWSASCRLYRSCTRWYSGTWRLLQQPRTAWLMAGWLLVSWARIAPKHQNDQNGLQILYFWLTSSVIPTLYTMDGWENSANKTRDPDRKDRAYFDFLHFVKCNLRTNVGTTFSPWMI